MECPNIGEINFTKPSIDALEEIRRKKHLGNALVLFSGAGHFATIFLGGTSLNTVYSAYSTDFELFAQAMSEVPSIVRNQIEKIAFNAYMSVGDYKEKQFWQAVYRGCNVD